MYYNADIDSYYCENRHVLTAQYEKKEKTANSGSADHSFR